MGERICLVFFVLLLFHLKYCYAIYNISTFQALLQGQTLVSPSQIFELGFFSLNNSANQYIGIWYKQMSPIKVIWVANREKPVRAAHFPASLVIGKRGNLELLDGKNNSLWSTKVDLLSTNNSFAVLLDNGNLVIKDGSSREELWHSFQHPVNAFLPGAKAGFNVKTGERYVLTSWKNDTVDPSLGNFVVGLAPQRPPEAFIWINGTTPYWRSGPWDKSKFTGVPDMNTFFRSPFNIIEDVDKGSTYLYLNWYNSSTFLTLVLSSEGVLKIMLKGRGHDWFTNWEAPKTHCDIYGVCGPFGVCKSFESPICKCVKGFEPKSFEEWSKGNWTGGCLRRNKLHYCGKNRNGLASQESKNDGFWKISNVKLPDLYEFVELGISVNGDNCKKWCLNNCSCIACAYVDGIGCLVWLEGLMDIQGFTFGGEDLFLRLAHAELVKGKKFMKIMIISLVAVIACGIIGAITFGLHRWRARRKGKRKKTGEHLDSIQANGSSRSTHQVSENQDPSELPIFDFGTILEATNDFSPTNKLGQGGFGPVYKGKLQDGKEIAVKRLSSSSAQGIEEFKNEMILYSKLQHRNLVRLLSYCIEKEEKLLVYEFMPNKSLDKFIFDSKKKAQLNWATRLNIIYGVARGLVYLHRDSCLRIIHRDLKVSNILLDEKMNPKISDFGLARIFQGTLDLANTQRVVGTLGYMAPEYAMGVIFSEKSDVFSFGVLMLEIVSGEKNTDFYYCEEHLSLLAFAWKLWSENRVLDLVDDALCGSFSALEAIRCLHIALLCVQDHSDDRPSIEDVISMLRNETNRPQPNQPIFTFKRSPKGNPQSQNYTKYSVNETTISDMVEGR